MTKALHRLQFFKRSLWVVTRRLDSGRKRQAWVDDFPSIFHKKKRSTLVFRIYFVGLNSLNFEKSLDSCIHSIKQCVCLSHRGVTVTTEDSHRTARDTRSSSPAEVGEYVAQEREHHRPDERASNPWKRVRAIGRGYFVADCLQLLWKNKSDCVDKEGKVSWIVENSPRLSAEGLLRATLKAPSQYQTWVQTPTYFVGS
jgi:hypothetical protein